MNPASSGSSAAKAALKELGFVVVGALTQVGDTRQKVFQVSVRRDAPNAKTMTVAARILNETRSLAEVNAEQDTAWQWSMNGARLACPLHPTPVEVEGRFVGVWEWLHHTKRPLSAREWGALLRNLHDTGTNVRTRVYDPMAPVSRKRPLIAQALATPGHPLSFRPGLVEDYWAAVADAQREVERPRPGAKRSCLHGDFGPSNAVATTRGPASYDVEYSGTEGDVAADFSNVDVLRRRFGWPPEFMSEFKRGYGEDAPTDQEIAPYTRVRELSVAGFSMIAADQDEAHRLEFDRRTPVITRPEATTEPWKHVGPGSDAMAIGHRIVLEVPRRLDLAAIVAPSPVTPETVLQGYGMGTSLAPLETREAS